VLALILVVLGLGLDEAILSLATSFLESAQLLVELVHLSLGLVHEMVILVDLLFQGLKNALLNAGALDAADVVAAAAAAGDC
jgi:hypothetical protein